MRRLLLLASLVTALKRGATRLIIEAAGKRTELEVQVDGGTDSSITWWTGPTWREFSY